VETSDPPESPEPAGDCENPIGDHRDTAKIQQLGEKYLSGRSRDFINVLMVPSTFVDPVACRDLAQAIFDVDRNDFGRIGTRTFVREKPHTKRETCQPAYFRNSANWAPVHTGCAVSLSWSAHRLARRQDS
jgi:hypothetical protein